MAATIVAIAVIRREFAPNAQSSKATVAPTQLTDERSVWEAATISAPQAPIRVVEVGDFECPFCKRFHRELVRLKREMGDSLQVVLVHYPLPQHRFAIPAARLAECARVQGRFEEVVNRLFEGQDSLGLKPWEEYAREAGVADVERLDACLRSKEIPARVTAGLALGKELAVTGTPTVIVNQWRFARPPYDSLEHYIRRMLRGEDIRK